MAKSIHEDASLCRTESGYSDNGPAWIGYVTPSKTGRTLYFNNWALAKLKGQRRDESGGNYIALETGESFWISGVKKNGQHRHWAGSGKVAIEAAAVTEYLEATGRKTLDHKRHQVCHDVVSTDIKRFAVLENVSMWTVDSIPADDLNTP